MYELKLHKNLTLEKWAKFSKTQQILMIANELNRLLNCIDANLSYEALREGMERMFELIDLTITTNSGGFKKEFLRWRESFWEFYLLDEREFKKSTDQIKAFYRVLMLANRETAELLD